jgi:hypothetical protein
MARSEEYRRLAADCVRIAQQTENQETKALLLHMAEKWRELAERADNQLGADK